MDLPRRLILTEATADGAAPDLNTVCSLGKRGVQVIYAHCNRIPTVKSKYIQKHIEIPPPDSSDFIPAILNIVKDFGCEVMKYINTDFVPERSMS